LFYTTFSGGVNVHKADFNYNGTTFTLSNNIGIASTNGADGLLFAQTATFSSPARAAI
jgi:hypothetical protein